MAQFKNVQIQKYFLAIKAIINNIGDYWVQNLTQLVSPAVRNFGSEAVTSYRPNALVFDDPQIRLNILQIGAYFLPNTPNVVYWKVRDVASPCTVSD